MTSINALVLTGFGLNCDNETAYALQLAGAIPHRIHINTLIQGAVKLEDYKIIVFGGGFSWADDHGAGVIQAVRMATNLGDKLRQFVSDDNLVIGICNGFQTLVNLGLLPGLNGNYQQRSVALINNDCGNFRDQWVTLAVNSKTPCIYTRDMENIDLPIRHGEGKFWAEPKILQQIEANEQVVLRYAFPDGTPAKQHFPHNPNGSIGDIAGICDPTGRIFGLMPHPEAYNHWTNHPDWALIKEHCRRKRRQLPSNKLTPGIQIFKKAVEYIQ
ncbi:MAG: phosphoribosylformylglycinamidine synthase subunit PurQ [Desulfobacteraceae bacterium]|jgi:phosphoribosylformylglycinamidine synthase